MAVNILRGSINITFLVYPTKRLSSILTCQWRVGEMLRLAALPFAIDDVEVHFG